MRPSLLSQSVIAAAFFAALSCGAAAQEAPSRGRAVDALGALDLDKDGAVTRAEARTGREAMFRRLDANRDGYLETSELGADREARRLNAADTDKDAKISFQEMMNAPYRAFDRLDANRNDTLDRDELERARALMERYGRRPG